MRSERRRLHPIAPGLVAVTIALAGTSSAWAQTPVAPSPSLPDPSLPPAAPAPTPPAPASEPTMEERFRRLEQRYEDMERRRSDEYKALSERYENLQKRIGGDAAGGGEPAAPDATASSGRGAEGTGGRTSNSPSGPNARENGGVGAEGTGGRTFVREAASSEKKKTPAKVQFDEGIEFSSEDDEFKLNFHNLTQAEYRGFPTRDQGQLRDQFFIPRQRWYFTGQATKNVEFYTVINRGYGSLDLLDAFLTLNISQSFVNDAPPSGEEAGTGAQGTGGRTAPDRSKGRTDPRLRFRIGRMKTPYLYEYFSISEGDLIAPERSLYAANLAGNRQVGFMFLGDIFKNRLGYAAGLYNGPRRDFNDTNSDKDLFLYLNTRPFLESETLTALKYLNIGGGVNGGFENNPTQPTSFTTANDQTTPGSNAVATTLSPTFLTFNNDVIEHGRRVQYSGHIAYFFKSLMILGEYGGGNLGYALNGKPNSQTNVPVNGWMLQGTYFLTGEELTRRVNVVRPLHDFGYKNGKFGFGAFEVHARYSQLELGKNLFSAGFADPNLFTNNAQAIDVGWNWYLNYYTKIYFDWQHSIFGNPVTTGSTNRMLSNYDIFWLRFQVFF